MQRSGWHSLTMILPENGGPTCPGSSDAVAFSDTGDLASIMKVLAYLHLLSMFSRVSTCSLLAAREISHHLPGTLQAWALANELASIKRSSYQHSDMPGMWADFTPFEGNVSVAACARKLRVAHFCSWVVEDGR